MAVERMKLRLDKYLADMGLGTRSQIKKDISKGQVLVNGTVSKDAGTRIDTEKDQVSYLGQAVTYAEYEYYHGYCKMDKENIPVLYPFGYGLSYTTFSYGDLQLDKTSVQGESGVLTASVQVTNTGKLEGEEVVQLYIGDPAASISRPMKELKNFQKISLKPGESRKVSFTITPEDLKFYNSALEYIWEPGLFNIYVGTNSRDVKSAQVTWNK